MKNLKPFFVIILISFMAASCGMHMGYMNNHNNNLTNVELNRKNFVVVEHVTGQATATYVFGIGGIGKKDLVNKAKTDMIKNANLVGSSKAIINVTVEAHDVMVLPFYRKRTITASGHIVEFTE